VPKFFVSGSDRPTARTVPSFFPVGSRLGLTNYLYGLYGWIIKLAHMAKISHKGSEEARNELPSLLDEAERGQATIITRRGRPIAALVPLDQYRLAAVNNLCLPSRGLRKDCGGEIAVAHSRSCATNGTADD
jgi:prevent-host-death family protein